MDSLWIDVIGNKWLAQGYPFFFGIGLTLAITLGASSVGYPELVNRMLGLLPSAIWTFAAVKLIARGWVLRALILRRILSYRAAIKVVVGWLAAALTVVLLLAALVPPEFLPLKYLALAVFLSLPFARFGAAPLALESNRHR